MILLPNVAIKILVEINISSSSFFFFFFINIVVLTYTIIYNIVIDIRSINII